MNSLITFSLNSSYPSIQGYSFYTGYIDDSGYQMTLDLHADVSGTTITQKFVQTLLLNNAQYVSPSNVSSFPSTGMGQTSTTTASSASSYTTSWRILSLVGGLTMLSMVLWLQLKEYSSFIINSIPSSVPLPLYFSPSVIVLETSWTLATTS